jgi:hypothetical protein
MAVVPLAPNRPFERRHYPRDPRGALARAAGRERAPAAPALAARFGQALTLLETGRWAHAFEELSALAHAGHTSAARIALMMANRGGPLFGGHFHATRDDLARWRQVAG